MILTAVWAVGLLIGTWSIARLRQLPRRDSQASDPTGRQATITVIIPARNEGANLPQLLTSVRTSAGRAEVRVAEVIVVDDASTDDTSAVAREHGATVIRLDGDPPSGWTGKSYACHRGAAAASGDVLVFLDADVTLHGDALDRVVTALERCGGLISVQPYHAVETAHEQLSAVCNAVTMMGSGAFAVWPLPRRPVAFGPCIASTQADYHDIGGHESVAGEVVEDVQLARRYAAYGLPTTVFAGADAISFRMYPRGVGQLVEGWTKNLTSGARLVDPVAASLSAWWLASCLGLGVTAVDLAIDANGDRSALLVAASLWLAVTLQVRWTVRRIGAFRWWTAIAHPIPLWAFVGLFVRSAWLTLVRRTVRWSGRRIVVDQARR